MSTGLITQVKKNIGKVYQQGIDVQTEAVNAYGVVFEEWKNRWLTATDYVTFSISSIGPFTQQTFTVPQGTTWKEVALFCDDSAIMQEVYDKYGSWYTYFSLTEENKPVIFNNYWYIQYNNGDVLGDDVVINEASYSVLGGNKVKSQQCPEAIRSAGKSIQRVYREQKQADYDEFWDAYQSNGGRTDYRGAFSGWLTNMKDLFKPKYNLQLNEIDHTFYLFHPELDIADALEQQGVEMIINATSATAFFSSCPNITHLGTLDFSTCTSLNNTINGCNKLTTIDKIILNSEGTTTFNNFLSNNPELTRWNIEGTIANSGIDLSASTKLGMGIIVVYRALTKDSTKAAGKTITMPMNAQDWIHGTPIKEEHEAAIEAGWTINFK